MKKLLIQFPEERVSAMIELLEDEAPKTTVQLWENAPFEGQLLHDIWSGPQVFLPLESIKCIEPENLTMFVQPGDIFFYCRKKYYYRGKPYRRECMAEIGIVYDRDSAPCGPRGQKSVNMCGRIIEGFDKLKQVCNSIIFKGPKIIKISRYEEEV